MTNERTPVEYELLQQGALFGELQIIETSVTPTLGNEDMHVRIVLSVDEDLVESCAFGLIFVLGVLSFSDARPRGQSGKWFEDEDQFEADDLLRHLRFDAGRLYLYVDYLRGRCVKTTVEVHKDGKVILDTVNRGQAATRWVDLLRGKRFLRPVHPLEVS